MQLFETTIKYATAIGERKPLPGETSPFNWRNITVLVIFTVMFTSVSGYLLFDAKEFRDYTTCFFPWITLLAVWFGIYIMTLKVPILYQLKEDAEDMVKTR